MTAQASSTFSLQSTERNRAAAREEMQQELQHMSDAMVREKGLLNHAQAALLLDVSTKRVGELVRLGKLTRFDFLGRTYVSMRETRDRYKLDLKAGRPPRSIAKRAVASIKATLQTDKAQAKLGGYAGPYVKAQHEAGKKKSREDLRKVFRAVSGRAKK